MNESKTLRDFYPMHQKVEEAIITLLVHWEYDV